MSKNWVVLVIILAVMFLFSGCAPTAQGAGKADPKTAGADPKDPATPKKDVFTLAKEGWVNFKDPKFAGSTNDMSCNTCHPYGGKDTSPTPKDKKTLIGQAKTFPKVVPMAGDKPVTLIEMINWCITNPLGGKALQDTDPLMLSMVQFHNVLEPKTFEADALPIINATCAPCHSGDTPIGKLNLVDKDTAVANADKIRVAIDTGLMPKSGTLTDKDFMTLIIWGTTEIDKT